MVQSALILFGFAMMPVCMFLMFYLDSIWFAFYWTAPVALGLILDTFLLIREWMRRRL